VKREKKNGATLHRPFPPKSGSQENPGSSLPQLKVKFPLVKLQ